MFLRLFRPFKKGAMDFIQKPFQQPQLQKLVDRAMRTAKELFARRQTLAANRALIEKLTPREQQVLERIVNGRLNKQIADDLGISIKTVEAHRASIMDRRLRHRSRSDARGREV